MNEISSLAAIVSLLETGEIEKAQLDLDRLVVKQPGCSEALRLRANLFLHRGDIQHAIGDYQAALTASPGNWAILEQLAVALTLNHDYHQAHEQVDGYLAVHPLDANALNRKGNIFFAEQKFEQALECFLRIESPTAATSLTLAETYYQLQQFEKAFHYAERIYEESGNINQIFKIIGERTGECNACGGHFDKTCCDKMIIGAASTQREKNNMLNIAKLVDSRNDNWFENGVNERGDTLFSCKYYSLKDGRCSNHANRSQICRDFPSSMLDIVFKPHCSYQFILREEFPLVFTSRKLLRDVVFLLEKTGRQSARDLILKMNGDRKE